MQAEEEEEALLASDGVDKVEDDVADELVEDSVEFAAEAVTSSSDDGANGQIANGEANGVSAWANMFSVALAHSAGSSCWSSELQGIMTTTLKQKLTSKGFGRPITSTVQTPDQTRPGIKNT
uniref:Uncharacterized protein n=1 Tax=Globodera rostochiensis TaxID=31243 RepID=A0A914H8F0_GLORO